VQKEVAANVPERRKARMDLQRRLRKLQRRDWWLWVASMLVILLLTLGVVSLSLPTLFREQGSFFQFNLDQSVRGLVGVVLLFNVYAVYQQIAMKRLHRQLAEQIETTARLETRTELLQKLAMLDPLTGLQNRRGGEERLQSEVSRSARHGYLLTVIVFDLDDFKQINDTHGHAAGDAVLKAFADRLQRIIRSSDSAVRMGGDEFLLMLPECSPEKAESLLARIGEVTAEQSGTKLAVKYTAGWAGFQPGDTMEKLIERADQMLYARKPRSRTQPALAANPA